jgi:hypothetical protein
MLHQSLVVWLIEGVFFVPFGNIQVALLELDDL